VNPRVALVTRALRCGGVSTFLFRLGRELAARGCDVEIVATEEKGEWFDLAAARGFRVTYVEGATGTPPKIHAAKVGRFLRESRPDVVLLNHAFHAQVALGMLHDSTFVVPILHNDIEDVVHVALGNPAAWNVAVAVSPRMLEIATERRPDRPNRLIAHGIEIPADTPAWIDRKAAARPFHLIYVGSLETGRKGVLALARIAASLPDRGRPFHLTIAGDGPDRWRLAEALQAETSLGSIEWLGAIEPERVRDKLADAHVLLLPSRHEGFGLVLIEAQACGCVPIATRLRGITDFAVEDGRTGRLFDIGDAGAAAAAATPAAAAAAMIEQLDLDRDAWHAMARTGYDSACERFEISRMGDAYAQLIEDGLAGRYPLPAPRGGLAPIDAEMVTWRDALPPRLLAFLRRVRDW
jgi:glycosyltransferase involved in cell wall biosynthesis